MVSKTKGYSKEQLKQVLYSHSNLEISRFLSSVREEIENISSCMQAITFLISLTLHDLIMINKLIRNRENGYILIDKDTTVGLYDCSGGAGSILCIDLEKDVKLTIKFIRTILPDGCDGYALDDVYGLCQSE